MYSSFSTNLRMWEYVFFFICSIFFERTVEGVNNKQKMMKRIMYGRGSLQLLQAKLMLKI